MSDNNAAIERLEREVRDLKDRAQILECISRHSRYQDRHDVAGLTGVYHPQGVDEHGKVVNAASHYADWVNALHSASFKHHTHNITTHTCDIDADTAHCESYVLFGLLSLDESAVWFGSGRYIDRLQRTAAGWKIAVRRTFVEYMFTADASPTKTEYYLEQGYPTGAQDKSDASYQRPLRVEKHPV